MRFSTLAAIALVASTAIVAGTPAYAACQDLGFSVNDYGKKGPTEDAKKLLDKFIVSYMKKNNISKYKVGKKKVTCELFLDFGFFDEYTCKAVAKVCWKGAPIQTAKN